MALLEVLGTLGQGWRTICHPATLEEAIAEGKIHGNGLYIFSVFGTSGLKKTWFGISGGQIAGISPYGFDATGAARQYPEPVMIAES